jgi:Spy/CpxP family protein refolding chaperone
MKLYIFLSVFLFTSTQLFAQKKPLTNIDTLSDASKVTAGKEISPISSLSIEEYTAFKNGDEMGLAKTAQVNNYPSPAQALAFEKDLKLSTSQKTQLKSAAEAIDFKAREMGRFILQHEKQLNDLFSNGKANEGSVIYFCNQIGLYQGELRNAHLQAYLKARHILTPDQLKRYARLKRDSNKH